MKKYAVAALCCVLVAGMFAGCRRNDGGNATQGTTQPSSSQTQPTQTTPTTQPTAPSTRPSESTVPTQTTPSTGNGSNGTGTPGDNASPTTGTGKNRIMPRY